MKAGRPVKTAGDYANARAVESAMLALANAGNEWPSPKEIIGRLRTEGAGAPRVVWNRGRARMLSDDRLLVRSTLDARKRGVERYQLRYVEGRPPKPIPLEEYQSLPEDLQRFYRAVSSEERQENARRNRAAIGGFAQIVERMATPVVLNSLTYARLAAETDRRKQIWAGTYVFDSELEKVTWEARRRDPAWWPPKIAAVVERSRPRELPRRFRLPTVAVESPGHHQATRRTPIHRSEA